MLKMLYPAQHGGLNVRKEHRICRIVEVAVAATAAAAVTVGALPCGRDGVVRPVVEVALRLFGL